MKLHESHPPPASVSWPALISAEGAVIAESHLKTAALLDQYVPEFETFLEGELVDWLLLPSFGRRYRWRQPGARVRRVPLTALCRFVYSWWMNRRFGAKQPLLAKELKTAEWIARRFAERLPPDAQRLVILQDYLPFLSELGVLEGRQYEVLLTRPSFAAIIEKLEGARALLPSTKSLTDFHVPDSWVSAETEALRRAERVVTPHEEYAKWFENVRKIEWETPQAMLPAAVRQPKSLLFPAHLSAREGAHAVLAVTDTLEIPLLVVGENVEGLAAGSDLVRFIKRNEIPWHEVAAVVHPTLFESWPRTHLYAKALEIPVVVTEACGLPEGDGVHLVPFADEETLAKTLERVLAREADFEIEPHLRRRQSLMIEPLP